MKHYCGTDIIEVERIKQAISDTNGFLERIYTKSELDAALSKQGIVKYEYFAGRFAAKEAVYKALSAINSDLFLCNIEILNDKENKNRPIVNILDDTFSVLIRQGKLAIDISISHLEKYAVAMAIATILN